MRHRLRLLLLTAEEAAKPTETDRCVGDGFCRFSHFTPPALLRRTLKFRHRRSHPAVTPKNCLNRPLATTIFLQNIARLV